MYSTYHQAAYMQAMTDEAFLRGIVKGAGLFSSPLLKYAQQEFPVRPEAAMIAAGVNPTPVQTQGYASTDEGVFDWWHRLPIRGPFTYSAIKGGIWAIPGAAVGAGIGSMLAKRPIYGGLLGAAGMGVIGGIGGLIDAYRYKMKRAELRAMMGEY